MGFEPDQHPSQVELVSKFTEQMKSTLKEVKTALAKSKDKMAQYYNQRHTTALKYRPVDRVYLDASDVHTTQPSQKLSHCPLGPFPIVQKVSNSAYHLCLPPAMKCIHPMFNMVKLTLAPDDPIIRRCAPPPPLLEIVDGEEEWVVDEILDSKVINQKLHYLVKWKDFRIKHNSWEPWNHVHALELVTEFYWWHPGALAAWHIQTMELNTISFQPTMVLGHHLLEGGVDVRGDPILIPTLTLTFLTPYSNPTPASQTPTLLVTPASNTSAWPPLYIPSHRCRTWTPDSILTHLS